MVDPTGTPGTSSSLPTNGSWSSHDTGSSTPITSVAPIVVVATNTSTGSPSGVSESQKISGSATAHVASDVAAHACSATAPRESHTVQSEQARAAPTPQGAASNSPTAHGAPQFRVSVTSRVTAAETPPSASSRVMEISRSSELSVVVVENSTAANTPSHASSSRGASPVIVSAYEAASQNTVKPTCTPDTLRTSPTRPEPDDSHTTASTHSALSGSSASTSGMSTSAASVTSCASVVGTNDRVGTSLLASSDSVTTAVWLAANWVSTATTCTTRSPSMGVSDDVSNTTRLSAASSCAVPTNAAPEATRFSCARSALNVAWITALALSASLSGGSVQSTRS
mmetsp:Transcript_22124/g.77525  ORF Transcript_22124/g.77525 Transcript_22124/m.77525 type:complete len:341 (+) Transcript_22124:4538-5560(+)